MKNANLDKFIEISELYDANMYGSHGREYFNRFNVIIILILEGN